MANLRKHVIQLQVALRDASRKLYRATFDNQAGIGGTEDEVLERTRETAAILARAMAGGDIIGRVEVKRWLRTRAIRQRAGVLPLVTMPFDRAIEFLLGLSPSDLGISSDDVRATYQAYEFRLAPGIAKDVVEAVRQQIGSIMREGGTERDFQKWSRGLEDGHVSDSYARTVFRTETNRAQNAGRVMQVIEDPDLSGWIVGRKYSAVGGHPGDGDTRDNHRFHHGSMYGMRHEAWNTIQPPNGWNCRCSALMVSKEYARRLGRWDEGDDSFRSDPWPPRAAENKWYPDKGFDVSPVGDIYGTGG